MAVLSIQSHVVYGYAGNTAAAFPMQRLGREVWAINTVEFSNHTGYGSWRGKILGAELAADLVTGLEERNVLNQCEAVLSGYLGDASLGEVIIDAVKKVRKVSPMMLYCCDPVMGDVGRGLYVKPDIPGIFKNQLIPIADITCPNQFELEELTGIKIIDKKTAVSAIDKLHNMGPSIVLLTSFKEKDGEISMLVSGRNGKYIAATEELPLGDGVAGTGDMTAAVFLSRYLETRDLEKSLELSISSIFGILKAGFKKGTYPELDFIKNQEELNTPSNFFKAVKL